MENKSDAAVFSKWWFSRIHDDVIKWIHFQRYWPFVRGIHRWPANSPNKGQWRGALIFSLICAWVNSREVGDLRRHCAHYDFTLIHRHSPINIACTMIYCISDISISVLHVWYAILSSKHKLGTCVNLEYDRMLIVCQPAELHEILVIRA